MYELTVGCDDRLIPALPDGYVRGAAIGGVGWVGYVVRRASDGGVCVVRVVRGRPAATVTALDGAIDR